MLGSFIFYAAGLLLTGRWLQQGGDRARTLRWIVSGYLALSLLIMLLFRLQPWGAMIQLPLLVWCVFGRPADRFGSSLALLVASAAISPQNVYGDGEVFPWLWDIFNKSVVYLHAQGVVWAGNTLPLLEASAGGVFKVLTREWLVLNYLLQTGNLLLGWWFAARLSGLVSPLPMLRYWNLPWPIALLVAVVLLVDAPRGVAGAVLLANAALVGVAICAIVAWHLHGLRRVLVVGVLLALGPALLQVLVLVAVADRLLGISQILRPQVVDAGALQLGYRAGVWSGRMAPRLLLLAGVLVPLLLIHWVGQIASRGALLSVLQGRLADPQVSYEVNDREVLVDADGLSFAIDRYEYVFAGEAAPKVGVTRQDALALCRMEGKQLCSIEAWMLACSEGTLKSYPPNWTTRTAFERCGRRPQEDQSPSDTTETCTNSWGISNQMGGVREWLADDLGNGIVAYAAGSARLDEAMSRSCDGIFYLRRSQQATLGDDPIGFRCCRPLEANP